jgi:hypothetical protein
VWGGLFKKKKGNIKIEQGLKKGHYYVSEGRKPGGFKTSNNQLWFFGNITGQHIGVEQRGNSRGY